MRVLYFDCFSGVSGDMILGSLLDLGADEQHVRAGLDDLGVSGYDLKVGKTLKRGITATQATVAVSNESAQHRHLADIERMMGASGLDDAIKERSMMMFRRLAETEARIHDSTPDRVHFHEVGATDSIVDIVGSLLALDTLDIDEIRCSPIHLGTGEITTEHGVLPVPAPATVELLEGAPVYSRGIRSELTTPTGAAWVTTMAGEFGPMPAMTLRSVGYGAGRKDLDGLPNVLRTVLGEAAAHDAEIDVVGVLETTIDDMNPEHYPWLIEQLFAAGARDVYLVPTICKQGRPGISLVVISDTDRVDDLARIVFEETSSFGVRYRLESRLILSRESREIDTRWGKIGVKIGRKDGKIVSVSPEFRECRTVAEREDVPLKVVYDEARALAAEMCKREGK